MELALFIVFGAIAVAAAVGVILSRNPGHSALFLLLNFATLAVFYVVLNAQFLAVAQVAVYAGAIVVLFLFVVMLIGGDVERETTEGHPYGQVAALVLAVLLLVSLGYGIFSGTLATASGPATIEALAKVGNVQAMGRELFTRFLLPFELVAVLLLVGMIGAVVLARRVRG